MLLVQVWAVTCESDVRKEQLCLFVNVSCFFIGFLRRAARVQDTAERHAG